jgi:hypothetical protein
MSGSVLRRRRAPVNSVAVTDSDVSPTVLFDGGGRLPGYRVSAMDHRRTRVATARRPDAVIDGEANGGEAGGHCPAPEGWMVDGAADPAPDYIVSVGVQAVVAGWCLWWWPRWPFIGNKCSGRSRRPECRRRSVSPRIRCAGRAEHSRQADQHIPHAAVPFHPVLCVAAKSVPVVRTNNT